jgi:hypothetical protein
VTLTVLNIDSELLSKLVARAMSEREKLVLEPPALLLKLKPELRPGRGGLFSMRWRNEHGSAEA